MLPIRALRLRLTPRDKCGDTGHLWFSPSSLPGPYRGRYGSSFPPVLMRSSEKLLLCPRLYSRWRIMLELDARSHAAKPRGQSCPGTGASAPQTEGLRWAELTVHGRSSPCLLWDTEAYLPSSFSVRRQFSLLLSPPLGLEWGMGWGETGGCWEDEFAPTPPPREEGASAGGGGGPPLCLGCKGNPRGD